MLSQSSQITYISMMYIGSGPGSTAGGLRTTTVAIIALSVMSVIREGKQVTAFHKQIDKDNIRASFVILSVSLFLVLFSTLLISTTESVSAGALDKHSFLDYLFVVTSAFGTTGLSTFAISDLHSFSKVVLMFMMLVGQLGIITMLKMLSHNKRDKNIVEPKYLKESIPLGH